MGGAFPDRPSRDLHDLDTDEEEEAFNTVERQEMLLKYLIDTTCTTVLAFRNFFNVAFSRISEAAAAHLSWQGPDYFSLL